MADFCKVFTCSSGPVKAEKAAERALRKLKMVKITTLEFKGMVENPSDPLDCKLDGPLGSELTLVPKLLGFNCTTSTGPASYLKGDGNYTGFIGEIQSCKADFSIMPKSMPLAGDPYDYSPVIAADKVSYSTMYKRPNRPSSDSDMLASFQDVDSYCWLAFAATLASIWLILKLLGSRRTVFRLVQCFFQYVKPHDNLTSTRFLGSTMIFGFYILAIFYSNFILSRIVRQEQPQVLKNFFDILRQDVDINFAHDFPIYNTLKNSRNPNVRKVAEKAELQGIEESTLEGGIQSYNKFVERPNKLFGVFGSYARSKMNRLLVCATMSKFGINEAMDKDKYSIWVPSDSPHDYFMSFGYSKCLDEDVRKVLDLGIRHEFEHDLYGEKYHGQVANIFKGSDLLSDVTADPLCYSDEIIIENPEENHAISLRNTAGLLVLLAIGTSLACGMMMREISCQRHFQPSKRKRKQRLARF